VSAVPVAVAARGGASADESSAFELLLVNSGLPAAHIEAAAALRARLKYGHLVSVALLDRNPVVAREADELAKRRPSTATVTGLRFDGYKRNWAAG